jgi:hypothetical protein
MFVDELTPIFKQLTRHPVSFLGGFCSGVLRLNLSDEPVKKWLDQQLGAYTSTRSGNQPHNGSVSGPQSISID